MDKRKRHPAPAVPPPAPPSPEFATTIWADLDRVREATPVELRQVTGVILHRYWQPVHHFLCRRGHEPEQAKDLTQGFFAEVVLDRRLLQRADRTRGRFRTLLLTALQRYVADVGRREGAAKRHPRAGLVSLQQVSSDDCLPAPDTLTPEEAFHRAWAAAVLQEVLSELRTDLLAGGREGYWRIFESRVVDPILSGAQPESIEHLARELGFDDPKRVANITVTVKRRFAALLRAKVAEWCTAEAEVDQEIREFIAILGASGAAR